MSQNSKSVSETSLHVPMLHKKQPLTKINFLLQFQASLILYCPWDLN